MSATTTTRPRIHTHRHIGLRVFNVHDRRVYRITDLIDEDRTAQITGRGCRFAITYGDLDRHYRSVQPF